MPSGEERVIARTSRAIAAAARDAAPRCQAGSSTGPRPCSPGRCSLTARSNIIAARFRTRRCMCRSGRRDLHARERDAMAVADSAARSQSSADAIDAIWRLHPGMIGHRFPPLQRHQAAGRLSWHNLFYAAPIGAPWRSLLSGSLGLLRRARATMIPARDADNLWHAARAGRSRLVSALGLLGTSAEAALLHFRGAFQNPAMYAPVTARRSPRAAVARMRARGATRALAHALVAAAHCGAWFHRRGRSMLAASARNMGGWRNWRQNILNGPPLPAPPSFHGTGARGSCRACTSARNDDDAAAPLSRLRCAAQAAHAVLERRRRAP